MIMNNKFSADTGNPANPSERQRERERETERERQRDGHGVGLARSALNQDERRRKGEHIWTVLHAACARRACLAHHGNCLVLKNWNRKIREGGRVDALSDDVERQRE